jgi:hypothetical protein
LNEIRPNAIDGPREKGALPSQIDSIEKTDCAVLDAIR